jgi:hypothetical protein
MDRILCASQAHQVGANHQEGQVTSRIINIIKADLIGDYTLYLQFDDQTEQVVDFKSFLSDSMHPQIRAYLDPKIFAEFRIEYGELVWGDYELCFPVYDLYRNRISSADRYQRAA